MSVGLLLNPDKVICARCGEPAPGWAFIQGFRFCHDGPAPTCFELSFEDNYTIDMYERGYEAIEWRRGVFVEVNE